MSRRAVVLIIGLVLLGGGAWLALGRVRAQHASLTVYDDGRPAAGRWVVFHDAAGAITASARSNDRGEASGPVGAEGGMITVAYGESIKQAITFGGVRPGERLVVGEAEEDEEPGVTVCTAAVTLPGPHPKAASYTVTLGVGATPVADPARPASMGVLERFLEGGRFAALAEALDANGESVAFAYARFEGCQADAGVVDARLPAWSEDFRTFAIEVTGAEASSRVGAHFWLAGKETDRVERGTREAAASEGVTLRFAAPRPLETKAAYRLAVYGAEGSCERSVIEERREAMPGHVQVELGDRRLPRVWDAAVERSDPSRPGVVWKRGPGNVAADALVVRTAWPETREHVWTLVLPPDAGDRLTLPALPEALVAWRPEPSAMSVAVALVDASFVEGFAEVKRKGLEVLGNAPKHADAVRVSYSVCGDLDF